MKLTVYVVLTAMTLSAHTSGKSDLWSLGVGEQRQFCFVVALAVNTSLPFEPSRVGAERTCGW